MACNKIERQNLRGALCIGIAKGFSDLLIYPLFSQGDRALIWICAVPRLFWPRCLLAISPGEQVSPPIHNSGIWKAGISFWGSLDSLLAECKATSFLEASCHITAKAMYNRKYAAIAMPIIDPLNISPKRRNVLCYMALWQYKTARPAWFYGKYPLDYGKEAIVVEVFWACRVCLIDIVGIASSNKGDSIFKNLSVFSIEMPCDIWFSPGFQLRFHLWLNFLEQNIVIS